MQLIMDTEPTIDIKDKMSAIEEPLDTNLKDPGESLKNELINGNKENIESQKNILECTVDTLNREDLKHKDQSITSLSTENLQSADKIEQENADRDAKTENEEKNKTSNVHSIQTTNINGNEDIDINESNSREQDAIAKTVSIEDSNHEEHLNLESKMLETNQVDDAMTISENIINEIENTSLSNINDHNIKVDCVTDTQVTNIKDDGKNDVGTEISKKTDIEIFDSEIENYASRINKEILKEKEDEITILDTEAKMSDSLVSKDLSTSEAETGASIESQKNTSDLEIMDIDVDDSKKGDESSSVPKTIDLEIDDKEFHDTNNTSASDITVCEANKTETVLKDKEIKTSDANPETNTADDKKNCELFVETENNIKDKEEVLDVDEIVKDSGESIKELESENKQQESKNQSEKPVEPKKSPICKLSNTLDILSDDEEEPPQSESEKETVADPVSTEKQCINIEDDDDIMLIDEDTEPKDESVQPADAEEKKEEEKAVGDSIDLDNNSEKLEMENVEDNILKDSSTAPENETGTASITTTAVQPEKQPQETIQEEAKKPLVASDFFKGYKKNLSDMTREELEEFCVLKIIEGIVDRSNLSDIKSKLKTMAQNIDEYKKKAMMLTKQNRDLQLVLKSVQEEQKKKSDTAITPLKITRSVGMQVLMTESNRPPNLRKKSMGNPGVNAINSNANKMVTRNPNQSPRSQKPAANTQQIPVPRLVPANPTVKPPSTPSPVLPASNSTPKVGNQSALNGMKVSTPAQKNAEKRTRAQSVTVDLTDDEPPAKVTPRSSPAPPVRLVSPQNLLTRPQFTQALNSPRKVFIPISGPQSQNIRPGQTIMLKSVPAPGQRMRGPPPHIARMSHNAVRLPRTQNNRHPAPLPECMKQYQPPNWKALPPAPDLKLSKVENGIVISWKIEGYQEDSYEEIASYQLYAYQETSSPPNTALWKKIGDVKALPLPMACTLTQFMAGFKYYFAVRAVDIRSRLGPFSLPGSILLLNKM